MAVQLVDWIKKKKEKKNKEPQRKDEGFRVLAGNAIRAEPVDLPRTTSRGEKNVSECALQRLVSVRLLLSFCCSCSTTAKARDVRNLRRKDEIRQFVLSKTSMDKLFTETLR